MSRRLVSRTDPDPVPRQVELVGVQRQYLRGGHARVVQHPPERQLPQADRQPEKLIDLIGAQWRRRGR
jgi:hypothetical protein